MSYSLLSLILHPQLISASEIRPEIPYSIDEDRFYPPSRVCNPEPARQVSFPACGKIVCARLERRISDRFAGSFADRLHRQMGLSDLESSRDGSGAYNCHRRANERSLVSALEREPPISSSSSFSSFSIYDSRRLAGWISRELVRPADVPPRSTAVRCYCHRRSLPL